MSRLDKFFAEQNEFRNNRRIFEWLCDDAERSALYGELRQARCPVLAVRSGSRGDWDIRGAPLKAVYLVSDFDQVAFGSACHLMAGGAGTRDVVKAGDPFLALRRKHAAH